MSSKVARLCGTWYDCHRAFAGFAMPTRPVPTPIHRVRALRARGVPPQPPSRADVDVALRLAIGREGLGLELARPARMECLSIVDLAATLPGVRFPVDVSGGVPRFRHRRGQLQRLEIEVGARTLERWLAPRLRGLVGTGAPEVWMGVRREGATVCVAAAPDPEQDRVRPEPVLAFDVHIMAAEENVQLVIERARGVNLPAPAVAMAIACMEAGLGSAAERTGAMFVVRRRPLHSPGRCFLRRGRVYPPPRTSAGSPSARKTIRGFSSPCTAPSLRPPAVTRCVLARSSACSRSRRCAGVWRSPDGTRSIRRGPRARAQARRDRSAHRRYRRARGRPRGGGTGHVGGGGGTRRCSSRHDDRRTSDRNGRRAGSHGELRARG